MATTGSLSEGVTALDSIAYIQPTRGAHEHAGSDGRGVLADLELGVLALGDDVLGVELAVGDELRHRLHDPVVGAYRVGRHHSTSARRTAWATASVPVISFSVCCTSRLVS